MFRFGNPDVLHACENPLQANASLGARKRRSCAGVGTTSEGKVFAVAGASEAKLIGLLVPARLAVHGGVGEHDASASRNIHATDRRALACESEAALHGTFVSQHFLDEIRNETVVLAQSLLQVFALSKDAKRGCQ